MNQEIFSASGTIVSGTSVSSGALMLSPLTMPASSYSITTYAPSRIFDKIDIQNMAVYKAQLEDALIGEKEEGR